MKLHYLDNAATTAVLPAAAQAAGIAMTSVFGNPSSLHRAGQQARELLERSRKTVASALGVKPDCLYFTGGGSESINTALRGAARKNRHLGKHIISTLLEHDAVLNTLNALKTEGWEITLLAVGSPVWFPLLLAAVIIVCSFLISLWAVIISLWAAFGALIGSGIGGAVAGAAYLCLGNKTLGIALLGAGLVCIGLGIFFFYTGKGLHPWHQKTPC